MNGHLPRCRCASGAHVRTQYAALRCTGRATRARGNIRRADHVGPARRASGAFLNGLNWPDTSAMVVR
jgi:hypothetical protein